MKVNKFFIQHRSVVFRSFDVFKRDKIQNITKKSGNYKYPIVSLFDLGE